MYHARFGITYDYYWRNYTGNIPRDAVEGGRDAHNRTTYIGQVSVKNHGIIPVTIYPGNPSVVAVAHGVHHVSTYVKILCSASKQNFRWIHVDAKNFQVLTNNKHVVQGGVENDILTYIGRIRYQSETIVAKVRERGAGNVKLYYPAGNSEQSTDAFEVLITVFASATEILMQKMSKISCGLHYDYYWRDYTGDIPTDAIEGGRDINNKITYIGQVYVHKFGISTVTIYPGNTTVVPSVTGYSVYNYCIKILCSPFKEKFKWVSTDAENLHVKMIGKHLVRGGVDNNGSCTNIGRLLHKGEIIVAKVCGSEVGNAKLYYCDGNSEKSTNSYEVFVNRLQVHNVLPYVVVAFPVNAAVLQYMPLCDGLYKRGFVTAILNRNL